MRLKQTPLNRKKDDERLARDHPELTKQKSAIKPEKEKITMSTTTITTSWKNWSGWKTIATVLITIVALGALGGAFYLGTQYQNSIHVNVYTQASEIAKLKR